LPSNRSMMRMYFKRGKDREERCKGERDKV